jgi:hypothetical protein
MIWLMSKAKKGGAYAARFLAEREDGMADFPIDRVPLLLSDLTAKQVWPAPPGTVRVRLKTRL